MAALSDVNLVFSGTGVVVAPTLCSGNKPPAVCNQALDPLSVALRIVAKPGHGPHEDALGYATGQYITVAYSGVEELANDSGVIVYRILGCVVAHELGHVLLGPDSHSATGIMKARYTGTELRRLRDSWLWFLPSQIAGIRAYVLSHQVRSPGVGTHPETQANR
jgi:hypothetical protein